MQQIVVNLTDAQYFALQLDIIDVAAWVQNAPLAKSASNISLIPESTWRAIVSAAAIAGVDTADTDAVMIYARDNALLKTADERQAENSAAPSA